MPVITHTKVDPGKLSSTAVNISNSISQLEAAVGSIQSTLTAGGGAGLQGTWTGPASTRFFSQLSVDMEFIQAHLNLIKTLNGRLKEASILFDKADNDAMAFVNQLQII